MKILYAATDTIAVPLLEALASKGLVVAVFTAPDKPGKRGSRLLPTPIKTKALELGLPVYTPETLRREARELVKSLGVDTLLSFCYGKIFGPMFLSLFDRTFNVHPSLLPKYRGCAPLYAAILNQDRECGISLQEIANGIDEGRLYSVMRFPLNGRETSQTLEERVSELAPDFVLRVLEQIEPIVPLPQEGEASYQNYIGRDDGKLDFSRSARELNAIIRACYPWPKAYCLFNGEKLIFTDVGTSVFDEIETTGGEAPGTVVALDKKKGLKIATGSGYLYVSRVLPPQRRECDALSFVNGRRDIIGSVLF